MCGIIGYASSKPPLSKEWLARGLKLMNHRGPDDSGEYWSDDGRVGLGHVRLSILDLSAAGHQPMSNEKGNLSLVFNGEIYNHKELRRELLLDGFKFYSSSDTEVILAAYEKWGEQCVNRFNGMFAFAIYDQMLGSIFLCRDRAGEKPLFYTSTNGQLRFASELKGLLADSSIPRKINKSAFDCFLAMGYVAGDECILDGFNKLPPAHAMKFIFATGEIKKWRYWSPPENSGVLSDDGDLVNELESLLDLAVKRQLEADVPIGVLLSGGVDSSLIVALAARNAGRVKTFTIGFPGHNNLDETKHARLIAERFATEHFEFQAEDITVDLLPALARQYDEPMVDSSMIPTYLVSNLVRKECKVALGGDGGDELFGGYHHHSRLLWMKDVLGQVPYSIRKAISLSANYALPVGFKGKNYLKALGTDFTIDLPLVASHFDSDSRSRILKRSQYLDPISEEYMRSRIPHQKDFLRRLTQMDFENYLPEDILVKVDRASMLNSLEIRSPFLDLDVIEFAFKNIPANLKCNHTERKILLKKLTEKLLPNEFDRTRKQGFSIPLAAWLKTGPFRKFFLDVLYDKDCFFNTKFVNSLIAGQDNGRANSERLFSLVLFELWRREYSIEL